MAWLSMLVSPAAVSSAESLDADRRWVLAIGIDRYTQLEPAELRPNFHLRFAVTDAEAVARTLGDLYGYEPVKLLTDQDATRERIFEHLYNLADPGRIGPNDSVVVYFSGHGLTVPLPNGGYEGFLLPSDAAVNVRDLEEGRNIREILSAAISMTEVRRMAARIPAKRVLFLLDSCFSGLAARERAIRIAAAPGHGSPQHHQDPGPSPDLSRLQRRSEQVIVGGDGNQTVVEHPAWGHGAFTKVLLDALRMGPDGLANEEGVLWTDALARHLQVEVPRLIRSQPGLESFTQTPQHAWLNGTDGGFAFMPPGLQSMESADPMPEPDGPPVTSDSLGTAELIYIEQRGEAVIESDANAQVDTSREDHAAATLAAVDAALLDAVHQTVPSIDRDELRTLLEHPTVQVVRRWHPIRQDVTDGRATAEVAIWLDPRASNILQQAQRRQAIHEGDLADIYAALGRPRLLVDIDQEIEGIDARQDLRRVQRAIEQALIDAGLDVYDSRQLERIAGQEADDEVRRQLLADRGVQFEISGTVYASSRGSVRVDPSLPPVHDYTAALEVAPVHTPTGRLFRPQMYETTGERSRRTAAFSKLEAAINVIDLLIEQAMTEIFRDLASQWVNLAEAHTVEVRIDAIGDARARAVIEHLLTKQRWLVRDVPEARYRLSGGNAIFDIVIAGEQATLEQVLSDVLAEYQLSDRTDGRLAYTQQ